MLFTFGSWIPFAVRLRVLGPCFFITLLCLNTVASQYEFDACDLPNRGTGICRVFEECQELVDAVKRKEITLNDPARCGFKGRQELICCPGSGGNVNSRDGKPTFDRIPKPVPQIVTTSSTTSKRPSTITRTERPSVAACRAIEEGLNPILTPHILDGTPVNPGEYPHMAAIGYSGIGNEGGPYDFRCGGTLIHERFVLTAAHCVNSRNITPSIVRLGMANFDDPEELPHRVDMTVRQVHVHPRYSLLNKINDVALIELPSPVPRSRYVAPTCLYTEEVDPPNGSMLFVAGWGVYNYTTKQTSNALLKARMKIVPDTSCTASYRDQGFTLRSEHLCASDPRNTADACWGDSGGPLLLLVDESTLNFKQVGIIVSGYGCAGSIPGLYMRVSSYLDFIEEIVWPEN